MDPASNHTSTATDRPLLPHQGDAQVPVLSSGGGGGGGGGATEPDPNFHNQRHSTGPDNFHQEADIADSGVGHDDEKYGSVSPPRRPPGEASPVEEAQALDWIVPVHNGIPQEKRGTVRERLQSTLDVAKVEQAKYAKRASLASMTINAAMFLQIILNALVTGISASPSGRTAQIGVSALGAIGTILGSFMVRVRGTREPERSVTHAQNLEKFIRTLEAFILDEGYSRDRKWDPKVKALREEFDSLQSAAHQSENGQPVV